MQIRYEKIQPGQGHIAGRRLLAQMYRQITGKPLPEIAIAPGGKPYFPDGSLHFSVSHTKRHVFCAVSNRPVGIDAEEIDRKIDLRLADKILSDTEKVHFENATDKRLTLLKFWVLKEAAAKLSGNVKNMTDYIVIFFTPSLFRFLLQSYRHVHFHPSHLKKYPHPSLK